MTTPKEPTTLEECLGILGEQARVNPSATLLTILDQLVDLACSGGGLVSNSPFVEFTKLRFYKSVIVRLAKAGVVPRTPSNQEPERSE